jgi:hypothetical protein
MYVSNLKKKNIFLYKKIRKIYLKKKKFFFFFQKLQQGKLPSAAHQPILDPKSISSFIEMNNQDQLNQLNFNKQKC